MFNQVAARELRESWSSSPRWQGIVRQHTAEDVIRLQGTVRIEHTLAQLGAERLWELIHTGPYVKALGAVTGNQAVQMIQAGLQAIYLSGWQVAADANLASQTYPDQSLYPMDSAPSLVKRINNALLRADQIANIQSQNGVHWMAPILADAESGFGGPLNTFELMKHFIEAGAAAVHLEDQLSSAKKCGHMGGKVLVPVSEFVRKLAAARLAADVLDVPTILVARTDADSATFIRSDIDELDRKFITGSRSIEGYHQVTGGLDYAAARALSYAPYVDMIWCETSTPDLGEAREFAQAIHEKYPGKLLAYNCSPSFNWRLHLDVPTIEKFQDKLGTYGYRFQFVTLAGFHALNTSMFELARGYKETGMTALSGLQEREFELQDEGYKAVKHQSFVGAGYFDQVQMAISGSETSTMALKGSTEEEQFVAKVAAD